MRAMEDEMPEMGLFVDEGGPWHRTDEGHPRDAATYARRNILHCKSVGALANATAALKRLRQQKAPPKWLVRYLESIVQRCKPVVDEMARHRDEVW
jgi:hypothetical protein